MEVRFNASWMPPPNASLYFSQCHATAPWVAYALVIASKLDVNKTSLTSNWAGATPLNIEVDFLRSLVPSDWPPPTDQDLLLWYPNFFGYIGIRIFLRIILITLFECGPKVCPNLDFSGDSDLSGIGMMISYYMVAIFATIYYFALVRGNFEAYGHSFGSPTIVSGYWKQYRKYAPGFEESVTGFLNAMLLFSISMLIAALSRYASLALHPNEPRSLFGLQDCVFMSTFAIFPTIILQSLSHDIRHRGARLALWGLIIVCVITMEVLYRVYYRDFVDNDFHLDYKALKSADPSPGHVEDAIDQISQYVSDHISEYINELSQITWFATCQSESLRQSLQDLLTVGHGVMGVNVLVWIDTIVEVYGKPSWLAALRKRMSPWRHWGTCRLWLRVGNELLCLAIMWAFLGLFTAYRHDVAKNAGDADQDDVWTFGQVLALATFIPVGAKLLSVYKPGARGNIERSHSSWYKVVDRNDTKVVADQMVYDRASGMEVISLETAHHA